MDGVRQERLIQKRSASMRNTISWVGDSNNKFHTCDGQKEGDLLSSHDLNHINRKSEELSKRSS